MLEENISLNRTETAYLRLREDLMSGRLKPGARLRIAELASTYQLNTSAVREALSRLTSEGIAIATPQRGFRAAPVSRKDLEDLTQARITIERMCLASAIEKGSLAWESEVVAAYYRLDRTPDPASSHTTVSNSWSDAHADFHHALVSACDNVWFLKMREMLFGQSERYRRLSLPNATVNRDVPSEHRLIMEAVLDRDAQRACDLLASHLEVTTEQLLDGQLAGVLSE